MQSAKQFGITELGERPFSPEGLDQIEEAYVDT